MAYKTYTRWNPTTGSRDVVLTLKMANTIPLSNLIGFLLHKSYHELTVLSELLPKKSDVERKIELVEYARSTRLLFIRLLALVKWASSAGNLSKCDEVSEALDQRSLFYVDTADELMALARNTLLNASLPNFSLAGAIDVLTLGKYPRLPTCIHDDIVPVPPLSLEENLNVCRQLEHVIQQRLAISVLPQQFLKNMKIGNGQVTFTVPYEFEVCLTVLGDDLALPWRLLKLVILVGSRQTGGGVDTAIHPQQKDYLHKLLQSRLFTDQSPLIDLHDTLHTFCMALKLDLLHIQVQLFSSQVSGDHVRVEEYFPGKLLQVVYWRLDPSQHNYSGEQASMVGRITIAIGGSSCDLSFNVDHSPNLPECGTREACEMLDVWLMIDQCVKMRSKLLLQELLGLFKNTVFEPYVTLSEDPLNLQVQLLPNNKYHLHVSVDKRMGRLIASVLPLVTSNAVQDKLDEIDRELSGNRSNLFNHILSLQLTVAMAVVMDTVVDCGLSYSTHLPILKPLPVPSPHIVYIHLPGIPNHYLVIGLSHKDSCYGIDYIHYLLETMHVPSVPLPHLGGVGEPSVFLATRSLIQLDEHSLLSSISRTIPVSVSRMLLKRKFDQSNLRLPSPKRLCLVPKADILVGVCARLCGCQAATTHLIKQLTRAGIIHHMIHHEAHMGSVVHVIQLPFTSGCDWDSYQLLSNRLQSCEIRWCDGQWIVKLLLLQDIIHQQSSLVICRYLYNFSEDVGERLCQDWASLLKLLGPVLELVKYQQEGSVAVEGWTITEFNYHQLKINHRSSEKLTIMAERGRLHLQLADDNPFNMVHSSLELMLNRSLCLPQLLQGMQSTLQPIILLHGLHNEIKHHTQQYIAIQSRSPSMIVLVFLNMYSIELYLNANSTVTIADGGSTTTDPAGIHGRTTPLWYLQSFLQRVLQDQGGVGDDHTSLSISPVAGTSAVASSQSNRSSTSTGAVLAPSPYPIASPRPSPIVTLSSPSPPPLPSLPPLPSPHSASLVAEKRSTNRGSWSRVLLWEQFQSLLSYNEGDGQCPLSRFLGNFYLLNQFNMQVKQDKMQSGLPRENQIHLRSVDRGVYVFQTETLALHISMDSSNFQKLKFTVQPVTEHVWSDNELETLCNYFHSQVSCPPYSGHAVTAFVRLLSVPLRVLKSCVHLMQLQMSPPADSYWNVRLCLTVPHSIDAPDIAIPGNPAVAFRGKLLIFLEFRGIRSYQGLELVIPILHDPNAKTNSTHLAKLQHAPNTSQLKISIMQAMDGVLRNTAQEYHYAPQLQQESSSLFPCIRAIVKSPLNVVND